MALALLPGYRVSIDVAIFLFPHQFFSLYFSFANDMNRCQCCFKLWNFWDCSNEKCLHFFWQLIRLLPSDEMDFIPGVTEKSWPHGLHLQVAGA